MYNTGTDAACLKLIFPKFSCTVKKVLVCYILVYIVMKRHVVWGIQITQIHLGNGY